MHRKIKDGIKHNFPIVKKDEMYYVDIYKMDKPFNIKTNYFENEDKLIIDRFKDIVKRGKMREDTKLKYFFASNNRRFKKTQ